MPNTQERKAKIVAQTEHAAKGTDGMRKERRDRAEEILVEGLSEANVAAYEGAHLALIREFADKLD